LKKRKHHYIWKHYLREWATNDQIYCLRNKEIFKTNLVNIGSRRDFYKLNKLTKQDIEFINKLYFENVHPEHAKFNQEWIPLFNKIFEVKEIMESQGSLAPAVLDEFEIAINNMLEDFHSNIEQKAVPLLASLKNGDFSFLDDLESYDNFIFFIALQYLRTSKMNDEVVKKGLEFNLSNFENIWKIFSIFFATSLTITFNIEQNEYKFVLLKSDKKIFIAGDQPIINTFANYNSNEILKKDQTELYYPLSPSLSLLITKSEKFENKEIKNIAEISAIHYNTQIYYASQDQVFSHEKTILEDFRILEK